MTLSNELLTATWNLDTGAPRALLSRILTERLDEVLVKGSDLSKLRQIERLGFPLEPAPTEHSHGGITTEDSGRSRESDSYQCILLPHLSQSTLPIQEHEFLVSTDDVRRYGEQSGDLNPLHFDDKVARQHGFSGRISHGMLFNGWFTRLLGTEFPGVGTIYLRSTCVYLGPIYPDHPYTVRISTPRYDSSRGTYRILAQVFAGDGTHVTIAYADVLNRIVSN